MTVIYDGTSRAARALDEALPAWFVEAYNKGAIAHKLDPRQHPNFYEQLEVHVMPYEGGWSIELNEQRTEMGAPERLDLLHADDLGDAVRAAKTLVRRWSRNESVSAESEFDFGGFGGGF